MRDFNLDDVYRFYDVLDAAGFTDEKVEEILSIANDRSLSVEKIGIKTIAKVMRSLAEKGAREPMFAFLAGVFEKTPEEMRETPLSEIVDGIKWLAEKGFLADFMGRLS